MRALPDMRRVLRYAATGGTAALVDLGGLALLLAAGLPLAGAGLLSFLLALLVNFGLSSRFVFGVPISLHRLPAFALGAAIGLSVNMGVTLFIAGLGVAPLLAKTVGIAVAFAVNYGVNARFVYQR
ncbi:MAG: GtrA family protein [Paracoccaceae bacterium]